MIGWSSSSSGSLTEVCGSVCRLSAESIEHDWVTRDLRRGQGEVFIQTYDSCAKMVLEAIYGFDDFVVFVCFILCDDLERSEDFLGKKLSVILELVERNKLGG